MDTLVRDIGITVFAILACARWWHIAKDVASRKYILLCGLCFLVTGISYITGESLDISSLMLVSGIAFLGFIYYLVKAIRSEGRAKKKQTKY